MVAVEKSFVPPVVPSTGHRVLAHEGGVLLLPAMRGDPLATAWWASDGTSFVEAPIDLQGVGLGDDPVVDTINSHHWAQRPTAGGVGFFRVAGRVVEATVGPRVTFRPSAYVSPVEFKFELRDLTVDETGTWWAGGNASRDELIGQVFVSADGAAWKEVPSKFQGSVHRIARSAGKTYALHFKHITAVTAAGGDKLASMKDHVLEAIVTPETTLAFGVDFVGVLPAGAKRAKYVAPPAGNGRYHAAPVEGGYLLGGAQGLWFSRDGLAWSAVPSFSGSVMAIVPSASGVVVVSTRSEVHVVRAS